MSFGLALGACLLLAGCVGTPARAPAYSYYPRPYAPRLARVAARPPGALPRPGADETGLTAAQKEEVFRSFDRQQHDPE